MAKQVDISDVGNGLLLIGLGGFGAILAPWLGISILYTYGFIALGAGLTALELYMMHTDKEEEAFKACGLEVDKKVPLVIKKTVDDVKGDDKD